MAGGRPPKYDESMPDIAKNYCILGAKDVELAGFFGISEETLNQWKHKYKEFSESIKEGKDIHDSGLVENALLKSAKGFTRKTVKTSEDGMTEILEEVPPNPTSMIFWLKNRDRNRWKDKLEHEHTGNVTVFANPFEKKPSSE